MLCLSVMALMLPAAGQPFDAAPFGTLSQDRTTIVWEDPREIHHVIVRFRTPPANPDRVHIEYWGSRWPEQRLPKDRQPSGGDVGWWELGNWYRGEWRRADTEVVRDGSSLRFTFRPLKALEYPKLSDYPATWRYTLKLRIVSDDPMPQVDAIQALTDSVIEERNLRLVWKRPHELPTVEVFNGHLSSVAVLYPTMCGIRLLATRNPDPNTFDRTLITVRSANHVFTFNVDDLERGPILISHAGVAVDSGNEIRGYAAIERAVRAGGAKSLIARVSERPEQTWQAAWSGMPAKKSDIYIPLGLDGGRQRFRLDADGSVTFRTNDHYLRARPGKDTPRLDLEPGPVHMSFGLPGRPKARTLVRQILPMVEAAYDTREVRIVQEAFVTVLEGMRATNDVPPADANAVLMLRLNVIRFAQSGTLRVPIRMDVGGKSRVLECGPDGKLLAEGTLRALITPPDEIGRTADGALELSWNLVPGKMRTVDLKLPYVVLHGADDEKEMAGLDYSREYYQVARYWERALNRSARLITPEPTLNDFYRAHAGHLLINCEREPGSTRRFARVGSFSYGAYGNESCMMVIDLDRRGYHKEAEECLDAWLHYQSTVGLPGDFDSRQGVLYGAGGYEAGGYNQHHGWILWCLAEHYRFTRDKAYLRRAAPGILAGAEWIIRERARTKDRKDLSHGLLPAGSLEDIGDWWPWLSTNCYTWRGLDSAAWALGQIAHPDAARLRREADAYHSALLSAFRAAAARSPVVRLRNGISVPHIPSQVFRRGRSFGWITETLEGALHLLITHALDPRSPEAGWILNDYEDNLFLSNQFGYTLPEFERYWFGRGGMSMQACLLLDVEPYLYRDDVKQALRAMFNAIAVGYFPDAHMLTEHSLPEMGDWRGDHYKSSDESNAAGWLRQIFLREEGDTLLIGQAVPRSWLSAGKRCGIERAATYFGPASVVYAGARNAITAKLNGPKRNPPSSIKLRFRDPMERPLKNVTVNGKPWRDFGGDWVHLPGNVGDATVVARWSGAAVRPAARRARQ